MKFTMCFAEWEERNPWTPLHVERGFDPQDSVVTAFTMTSGPTLMVDQDSRSAAQLAGSFGLCLESAFHPKAHYATEVLVVVCPEHVDTLLRDGYEQGGDPRAHSGRDRSAGLRELVGDEVSAVGFKPEAAAAMSARPSWPGRCRSFRRAKTSIWSWPGRRPASFSGAFHGWATGGLANRQNRGSRVSRNFSDAQRYQCSRRLLPMNDSR